MEIKWSYYDFIFIIHLFNMFIDWYQEQAQKYWLGLDSVITLTR